jgi:hypothetical protein
MSFGFPVADSGRSSPFVQRLMHRGVLALLVALPAAVHAQFATVGAGVLASNRKPEPVAELHAETPPVFASRAYLTLSWTDESSALAVITAVITAAALA